MTKKRAIALTPEVKAVLRLMDRKEWHEVAGDYPRHVVHAAKFCHQYGITREFYAEGSKATEWDLWDEDAWKMSGRGAGYDKESGDIDALVTRGEGDWLTGERPQPEDEGDHGRIIEVPED